MSKTPVLGEGPHKLHWRATWGVYISGFLLAFISVLVLMGFVASTVDGIVATNAESDIWENGIVAPEAYVHEDWTSDENIISSYNLTIDWVDVDGEHHETPHGFSTLSTVEAGPEIEVRYIATDEGYAIATSWSEPVRGSRLGANLCLLFFGLVFAGIGLAVGVGVVRRRRRLSDAIAGSQELWLSVVSMMEDKSDGGPDLIFTLRDEENDRQFMERFKKGPPLIVGPDQEHALALRRTDGELVVLRHDLYPLVKTEDERTEIRRRAALPKT